MRTHQDRSGRELSAVEYAAAVPARGVIVQRTAAGGVHASLRASGFGRCYPAVEEWCQRIGAVMVCSLLAFMLACAMWNPVLARWLGAIRYDPPPVAGRMMFLAIAAVIAVGMWRGYRAAWIPTVIEWEGEGADTLSVTTPGTWRALTRRFDVRAYVAAQVIRRREGDDYPYVLQLIPAGNGPPVDVLSSADGYAGRDLARVARRALRPALARLSDAGRGRDQARR